MLLACLLAIKVPANHCMLLLMSDCVLELFALLPRSENCANKGLFLVDHPLIVKHQARCHTTHIHDLARAAARRIIFRCACLQLTGLLARNGTTFHLSHIFRILLIIFRILSSHLIVHRRRDCIRCILAAYLSAAKCLFLIIPVLLLLSEAERGVVIVRGITAAEHLNKLCFRIVRHQLLSLHLFPLVVFNIALLEV